MPVRARSILILSFVGAWLTYAGVIHAQDLVILPPRVSGFHAFEGIRFELGTVDPDGAGLATTYGVATGLGTLLWPPLDFNIGLRYWSADLDKGGPEGKASMKDLSFHGGIYWHPFRLLFLRPFGLAGAALHFVGADIPGDSQRQGDYDGVKGGIDLGVGVETAFTGINVRGEVRGESGAEATNWNVVIAAGWWPKRNAVAMPKGSPVPTGTHVPAAAAPVAAAPAAAAPAAAAVPVAATAAAPAAAVPAAAAPVAVSPDLTLQSQVDSLRAAVANLAAMMRPQDATDAAGTADSEQTAVAAPASSAVAEPKSVADNPSRVRAWFERLAILNGDPQAFSEKDGVLTFTASEGVSFASGGAALDDISRQKIRRFAAVMLVYPEVQVELIGHADNVGSARKNLSISEGRARAVAKELESLGIPAARMTVRGEGSSRPIADNSTPEGRARNRRVEGRLTARGDAR